MTDTTTPTPTTAPDRGLQRWFVAVLSVVVAAALAAMGTFGRGDNALGEYLVALLISVVAAAIVFGAVIPRTERSGMYSRNGAILSVLGVLSVFVFWTGLPPIFGLGGLYLGSQQRDKLGLAAVALGALAVFAAAVVYFADVI
jgi:hypothetical protein